MKRIARAAAAPVVVLGIVSAALLARNRSAAADGVPAPPGGPAPATRPADGDRLVVHEWGTFTGFAGSDGVHLPFATTVGSDLPPFVGNRQRNVTDTGGQLPLEVLFLKADGAEALQRMETPVLYFYADRPREVDVRVDFPGGLLTEFYPPVRRLGPTYGHGLGEPAYRRAAAVAATRPAAPKPAAVADGMAADDPAAAATAAAGAGALVTADPVAALATAGLPPDARASFLDWGRVRVVPRPTGDDGSRVPPVTDANHYQHARETDANLVQVDLPTGKRHEERLLFYRGVGNFGLPVRLAAKGGDRFELTAGGPDPLGSAFLIETPTAASPTVPMVRFAQLSNVTGRREAVLPAHAVPERKLADAIVSALVAEGLYEREALAMVRTWRASWLGEPGTRVLYTLPRRLTDALLPLAVSPTPDEVARVFVGRIDVLTPEAESRLRSMLSAAAAGPDALSDGDVRLLAGLGRFRRPALDRAAGTGTGGPAEANAAAAAQVRQLQDAFGVRQRAGQH